MAKEKPILEEQKERLLIDYKTLSEQLITNSIKGRKDAVAETISSYVLEDNKALSFDWIRLEWEMNSKAQEMKVDFGLISEMINSINTAVSAVMTRKLVVSKEIQESRDDKSLHNNYLLRTLGGVMLEASVKDVNRFLKNTELKERLRKQIEKQMNLLGLHPLEVEDSLCVIPSFSLPKISFHEINDILEDEGLSALSSKKEVWHTLQKLPNVSEISYLPWVVLFIIKEKHPESFREHDNSGIVQNSVASWTCSSLDKDLLRLWIEKCNIIEGESGWESEGFKWCFGIPENFKECCVQSVISEIAFISEYVFNNEQVKQRTNVGLRLSYSEFNSNYEVFWSLQDDKSNKWQGINELAKIKIPTSFNRWISSSLLPDIIRKGASRGFSIAEIESEIGFRGINKDLISFKTSNQVKKDKYKIN